jgi:hypothetical protein
MPILMEWLLAFAVVAVGLAATIWIARNGRRMRGLAGLGAILLGFGHVIDPPQQHRTEAAAQKKGAPENDEPREPI